MGCDDDDDDVDDDDMMMMMMMMMQWGFPGVEQLAHALLTLSPASSSHVVY